MKRRWKRSGSAEPAPPGIEPSDRLCASHALVARLNEQKDVCLDGMQLVMHTSFSEIHWRIQKDKSLVAGSNLLLSTYCFSKNKPPYLINHKDHLVQFQKLNFIHQIEFDQKINFLTNLTCLYRGQYDWLEGYKSAKRAPFWSLKV